MSETAGKTDPRVQRTRELLLQAFAKLAAERHNVHSISVQDIAQLSGVNRTTFYAHFDDKYAILDAWIRVKFHRVLERQFSSSSVLRKDTLLSLIGAVFDFLAHYRDTLKPADRQFEPLFETALQQELYEILLLWFKRMPSELQGDEETLETTAQVISWAIFGPAVQWSRGSRSVPAEDITPRVLSIVIAGLSPIINLL